MEYQWYPGHMTKARRMMQENMGLIDLVIELADARIPAASRNPDINDLAWNKPRIVLLNKSDLADEAVTRAWMKHLEQEGVYAVSLDARNRSGMKAIDANVAKACAAKIERDRARGILNRPVRAMVVGIPNVGKSTFINSFAKKAVAKTGNKPGVTKGKQWIRMSKTLELLDTPGILWPKMGDPETGLHLALIGSMNDEILDPEKMALQLIEMLERSYPELLGKRYGFEDPGMFGNEENREHRILEGIAKVRGCLGKGGEASCEKAAGILLEDFRSGRLGRISLERPGDETKGDMQEETHAEGNGN
ncbi:MAG: ribosome biogenesis GTPase YlqF [Lachnospiraceae bacterium]|nr:ribosome biogenesis GTPase YlqF [Lachnospiraceae bacterium]